MASLLPLLHDLLPIFMPSKVQVARGGELVAVEERAERPPWYRQEPRVDDEPRAESTAPKDIAVDVEDAAELPLSDLSSGISEPIRLLDYEEKHAASDDAPNEEEAAMTGLPDLTGEGASATPQHQGGPRVFRQDAMVGVSDKMCVTDTIVYATTAGVLLTSPSLNTVKALRADIKGEQLTSEEEQPRRQELGPGDFAFIPAWTEHQIVNEGSEKDVSWVLVRGGGEPVQVDLDDWGGGRLVR